MDKMDAILDRAEQQKLDGDPVRREQAKLAPVRAWAVKEQREFIAELATRSPRSDAALNTLNRLVGLMGGPPRDSRELWEKLEQLKTGIPAGFQLIVERIDHLTAWEAGQRNFMIPLYNARACPPGNISHYESVLVDLEQSLEKHIARLAERTPA